MEKKKRAGRKPLPEGAQPKKEVMKRYRANGTILQRTLTYKRWLGDVMDEQAALRGKSINAYFIDALKSDAAGHLYIIPDYTEEEAMEQLRMLGGADITQETIHTALGLLSDPEHAALKTIEENTGTAPETLLTYLAMFMCMEMTYTGAETILCCLDKLGADRETVCNALAQAGVHPAVPAQCKKSEIEEPEEAKRTAGPPKKEDRIRKE